MPCYRCGVRQVDPLRGQSPWQRGVKGDRQVLVCPDCQAAPAWHDDLDRCAECGSTRLVRRLGEVECRDCGFVPAAAGDLAGAADGPAPGLAEEVALALERVLGRNPRQPSLPSARREADTSGRIAQW
jgi:hypothetical protein